MRPDAVAPLLIARAHAESTARKDVRQAILDGALLKVHNGWYTTADEYAELYAEEQHLARVLAVSRSMRGSDSVVSHVSAAVLWELPLYRLDPARVHLTLPGSTESPSSAAVMRHRDALPNEDVVERHGIRSTSLERTVIDMARSVPLEASICAADAAFRIHAWDDDTRTYDERKAARFRARLWARLARMRGRRGVKQARLVVELADGRAHGPGESVSRFYLINLGFRPRLQVEVPGPDGIRYLVDFALDEAGAWGEFDGELKYTDPRYTQGRTREQVLARQELRQDWITWTTGRPFARWGSEHLGSELALAARLAEFGIRPPARPAVTRTAPAPSTAPGIARG